MIYRSIESYILSIILTYVDRYIKNFRREDVKLSLWEGDGVLCNLDLDLEVLEEELNLPFSFVSGHIHQLHIHVPWTRIASESVKITINTIECVMILKPSGQRSHPGPKKKSRMAAGTSAEDGSTVGAPPSYGASLVNKIVCNLEVTCNNLILKYLEGGTVLSMNIKTVSLKPVNKAAQPEFSELTATDLTLRKLVTLTDVTVCLDRRNSSGRIESYLEPLLYKCCLSVLISRSYPSVTCPHASSTRIAVHCKDFTFSVSHPQVAMLVRLINLTQMAIAQSRVIDGASTYADSSHSADGMSQESDEDYSLEGWGSWLLGFVPLVGATEGTSESQRPQPAKTHFGFYIDAVTILLKLGRSLEEAGGRTGSWITVLQARLGGCLVEASSAQDWHNVQAGVCSIQVSPEQQNDRPQEVYMECGEVPDNFLSGTLYDKVDLDLVQRPWDYHLSTLTETVMMERCPTFYFDYLSIVEKEPYEFETHSKLLGDIRHKSMNRYVVGPVSIGVCSGLLHRLDMLKRALEPGESPGSDLEPPLALPTPADNGSLVINLSDDEVEDIRETLETEEGCHIGQSVSQMTLFGARIRIYPGDKSSLRQQGGGTNTNGCHLLVRVKCVDAKWTKPLKYHLDRLAALSRRIGPLPGHVAAAAATNMSLLVVDSKLTLVVKDVEGPDTVQISNLSLAMTVNNLPTHMFHMQNPAQTYGSSSMLLLEKLVMVCTKPKVILSYEIVSSLLDSDSGKSGDFLYNSTLVRDCRNSNDWLYLEGRVNGTEMKFTDGLTWKLCSLKVADAQVSCVSAGGVREPILVPGDPSEPILQVLVQWPINEGNEETVSPVLVVRVSRLKISLTKGLCLWLVYSPQARHRKAFDIMTTSGRKASTSSRGSRKQSSDAAESVHPAAKSQTLSIFYTEALLSGRWSRWIVSCKSAGVDIDWPSPSECPGWGLALGVASLSVISPLGLKLSPTALAQTPVPVEKHIHQSANLPWTLAATEVDAASTGPVREEVLAPTSITLTVALTTRSGTQPTVSLCLHADTTPLHVSLGHRQVVLLSELAATGSQVYHSLASSESQPVPLVSKPRRQSPDPTEDSASASLKYTQGSAKGATSATTPRLSIWLQWTLAKASLSLYSARRPAQAKFLFDIDDVFVTLDVEAIYQKLKIKVATASATHYTRCGPRDSWKTGEYGGVLMRGNEVPGSDEGSDFISITATRASRLNLQAKLADTKGGDGWGVTAAAAAAASAGSERRYVTEVVTRVQPLDVVVPPAAVAALADVLAPLLDADDVHPLGRAYSQSPIQGQSMLSLTTTTLPLFYFDVSLIRIVIPCPSPSSTPRDNAEDTLLVHVERVSVSSEAVNPVSRKFLRSKVSTTGYGGTSRRYSSSPYLDDRQYQLDIGSISLHTGSWKWLSVELGGDGPSSQNPAVYWNSGGDPARAPTALLSPLCLTAVVAPPIISYSVIVSGLYVEVNAVSEIEGVMSLDQIRLVTRLISEFALTLPDSIPKSEPLHVTQNQPTLHLQTEPASSALTEVSSPLPDSGIESAESTSISYKKAKDTPKPAMKSKSMSQLSLSTATSVNTRKYHYRSQTVPIDILVTTKSIVMKVYKSCEDGADPLLYVLVSQPYIAIEKQGDMSVFKGSVYEVEVRHGPSSSTGALSGSLAGTAFRESLPTALVENAAGETDPYKEIPPPLLNFRATTQGVAPPAVEIEIGRPVKLLCQPTSIDYTKWLLSTLADCIQCSQNNNSEVSQHVYYENSPSTSPLDRIKARLEACSALSLSTKQIVLHLDTTKSNNREVLLSVGSIRSVTDWGQGSIRVSTDITEFCLAGGAPCPLVAGPWNFSVIVGWRPSVLAWTIAVFAGVLTIDLSKDTIDSLRKVSEEFLPYFGSRANSLADEAKSALKDNTSSAPTSSPSHSVGESEEEMHYRDDLQAGAFQFVTSPTSRPPQPYQVIFPLPSQMAWAYPSPRIVTDVRLLPVPLPNGGTAAVSIDFLDDCQRWRRCVRLESDMTGSVSATGQRTRPASVWRASVEGDLPAKALAAALRVDSMVSPTAIPALDITLDITSFQVSFWIKQNKIDKLPLPLSRYTTMTSVSSYFPAGTLYLEMASILLLHWAHNGESLLNGECRPRLDVLNPRLLVEQCVVQPFNLRWRASRLARWSLEMDIGRVSATIALPLASTLRAANGALLSSYVIANDTTALLRLGQMGTSEEIVLGCLQSYFYSWRSVKSPHKLRFSFAPAEEGRRTIWSEQLVDPSEEGNTTLILEDESAHPVPIVVTISHLSPALTYIAVRGRLVLYNSLERPMTARVVSDDKSKRPMAVPMTPRSRPPTVPVGEGSHSLSLSIFDGTWSGLVPLNSNNCVWLVKVPLKDREDYVSIWCQIIHETDVENPRLFVMLSAVYQVRNWLPFPASVETSTPSLARVSTQSLPGRGALSDLRAPGTASHKHSLRFYIDGEETGGSMPLSHSLVEGRGPAPPAVPPVDVLIAAADVPTHGKMWPLVADIAGHPVLHSASAPPAPTVINVKVKFGKDVLSRVSNCIVVELAPWALVTNTTSIDIFIYDSAGGRPIASIPSRGVAAPPRLQSGWSVGLDAGGRIYKSGQLELSESQVFFMPSTTGVVPIDGALPLPVPMGDKMGCITIQSKVDNSIRVMHITPTYSIINISSINLKVAAVLLTPGNRKSIIPQSIESYSIKLPLQKASGNPVGIGITSWHCLSGTANGSNYVHYLLFESDGLVSSPALITQAERHSQVVLLPVKSDGNAKSGKCNIGLVVVTETRDGLTRIVVDDVKSPRLVIHNATSRPLAVARVSSESATTLGGIPNQGVGIPLDDYEEWEWRLIVPARRSAVYFISRTEIQPKNDCSFSIVVAKPPFDVWSSSIVVCGGAVSGRLVSTDGSGTAADASATVIKRGRTIHVLLARADRGLVAAADIRSRLDVLRGQTGKGLEMAKEDAIRRGYLLPPLSSPSRYLLQRSLPVLLPPMPLLSESRDESCDSDDSCDEAAAASLLCPVTASGHFACAEISLRFEGIAITLAREDPRLGYSWSRVATLCLDAVTLSSSAPEVGGERSVSLAVGEMQIDNDEFRGGGYDFGVVAVCRAVPSAPAIGVTIIADHRAVPILQDVEVRLSPMELFLEDAFLTRINTEMTLLVGEPFVVADSLESEECSSQKPIMSEPIKPQDRSVPVEVASSAGSSDGCYGGSESGESQVPLAPILQSRVLSPVEATSGGDTTEEIEVEDEDLDEPLPVAGSSEENLPPDAVVFPRLTLVSALELSRPLLLRTLTIGELTVSVSLHTSTRFYIALDNSPLKFAEFSRKELVTSTYRLGHALTVHYFLGAIYGTGWALGSLQLLGAPAGLARSLSQGLKSFVTMPCMGAIEHGPTGFFVGVLHGSVALMKHVTAGTLTSLTKLAGSWSRTLDRLTLDDDDLRYAEEMRRLRPHGLAQSLRQGFTELGVSVLGGVGGLAQQPLQYVAQGNKSLAGALSSALVGAVTRPISGAAGLLALTGHGILSGAGWTDSHLPRCEGGRPGRVASPTESRLKLAALAAPFGPLVGAVAATWGGETVTVAVARGALVAVTDAGEIAAAVPLAAVEPPLPDPVDPTRVNVIIPPEDRDDPQRYSMRRVEEYIRRLGGEARATEGGRTIEVYLSPDLRERLISLCRVALAASRPLGFPVL